MESQMSYLPNFYPSMRLIEDKNLTEPGTIPVRLKGRGITVHRRAMVPSTHLYEIQPGLWVGHPATLRAFEEQVRRRVGEKMDNYFDGITRAIWGVGYAASQSSLSFADFAEAVKRVKESE